MLAIFAVSCETKAPEQVSPIINVELTHNLGYESAVYTIQYSIEKAIGNAELSADTDCKWITNLSVGVSEISFDILENNEMERQGHIRLEYPNAEGVDLIITQSGREYESLSSEGTANCYIVAAPGSYCFKVVKGNGKESVGKANSADVLWESFGTEEVPNVGDLIPHVYFDGENVNFVTSDNYKEGNAVIAVRDSDEEILWSWHIWFTDIPSDQEYLNGAGTYMDRNLGATSAAPGDPGALGLMYQWGRKDPFLGSSSISLNTKAKSTITWPPVVSCNEFYGTVEYVTSHPTTFVAYDPLSYDWFFCGSSNPDNTRWLSEKTIYDPCPAGYRVPDGGMGYNWFKAFGDQQFLTAVYDSENCGYDFGSSSGNQALTNDDVCWFPAAGLLGCSDSVLIEVNFSGGYISCITDEYYTSSFKFFNNGTVLSSLGLYRANGSSIRCVKEN